MSAIAESVVTMTEREELERKAEMLGEQIREGYNLAMLLEANLLGAEGTTPTPLPERPEHFVGWLRRAFEEQQTDAASTRDVLRHLVESFTRRTGMTSDRVQ